MNVFGQLLLHHTLDLVVLMRYMLPVKSMAPSLSLMWCLEMSGCAAGRVTWHLNYVMLAVVYHIKLCACMNSNVFTWQAFNATAEIHAAGDYSNIRLFTAAKVESNKTEREFLKIVQPWQVASPGDIASVNIVLNKITNNGLQRLWMVLDTFLLSVGSLLATCTTDTGFQLA